MRKKQHLHWCIAPVLSFVAIGCNSQSDAPEVVGARALSSKAILVEFAEPVGSVADVVANYLVRGPYSELLAVHDIDVNADRTTATLTTDDQQEDLSYSLIFAGGTFIPVQTFSPPRVVGAAAINNTTVIVTFNKKMGPSAELAFNYVIVEENSNSEAGVLIVENASFIEPQQDAVKLATLPQNEVNYVVRVVNVLDLSGSQMAPPELLVDPSIATFRGMPASCTNVCANGSSGPCETDDDCDDDAPCDPGEEDCQNSCICELTDTDGDGLPDHVEQRGWLVTIELTNRDGNFDRRDTHSRDVTSDPRIPDTDGDGLSDKTERELATDPRDPDTDGDGINDEREFNLFFSSPVDQDTDEDQLDDFLEITFYKTSAILADTDGDGLDDDRELLELNRNPRIADLPEWEIETGDIRLQIDERYTFVDETGQTVTEISNTSQNYIREDRSERLDYNHKINRKGVEVGFSLGFSGLKLEGGVTGKGFANRDTYKGSDTTTTTAFQDAYESSLTRGKEFTTTRSVTREVFGASITAPLTVRATGDISFSISNLELSVLQLNRTRTGYVPIATLVPAAELQTGEGTTLNLGPLVAERGPINLENQEVFPSLVEGLLRSSQGPIIVPANFDITDEFGRNFAFASQETNDRTATIDIDFGDGTLKRFNVAIAGAIDDQGFVGPAGEFVGGFDEEGRSRGIPMDYALQDILGFEKNATENDAIIAGDNGIAETVAAGDDVQEVPISTTGLNDRTIIVSAGDNGVLDTVVLGGDDKGAVTRGYATSKTCSEGTVDRIIEPPDNGDGFANTLTAHDDVQEIDLNDPAAAGAVIISAGPNGIIDTVPAGDDVRRGPGDLCDEDEEEDCPGGGSCTGREVLSRFANAANGDRNRAWVTLVDQDIPVGTTFGELILTARMNVTIGFLQDIDRDGLFARYEYSFGTDDKKKDTDDDGLGDFAEVREGWIVQVEGQPDRQVFPDPRLPDSDGDGITDPNEMTAGTDPRKRDTDGDGIDDKTELEDDTVCSNAPEVCCTDQADCDLLEECLDDSQICAGNGRPCETDADCAGTCTDLDPLDPDTDGDGVEDGIELALGSSPLDPDDADSFRDTDEDGLTDQEEINGWEVTVVSCNNTCADAYDGTCQEVNTCSSGPAEDTACSVDSDCGNPQCLMLSGSCDNNPFAPPCTDDSQCDFGPCVEFGQFSVCAGAFIDCDNDADCSGSCVGNASFCIGSSNPGAECTNNSDCEQPLCEALCSVGTDCADCGPEMSTITRHSDPTMGDTDFDGLPDRVERDRATDPTSTDTDGDGLLDFDEFSDFGLFFPLNEQFSGFFLTDAGSMMYGTSLTSQDTDGDGLSDNFELLQGWRVFGVTDSEARDVFSSPNLADTDLDGLLDAREYAGVDTRPQGFPGDTGDATDPTDADTDDDGRLDGEEVDGALPSNPLVPDIAFTVTFDGGLILVGPEDGDDEVNEWVINVKVGVPTRDEVFQVFDTQDLCVLTNECATGGSCPTLWLTRNIASVNFSNSSGFSLDADEPITFEILILEISGCSGESPIVSCIMTEQTAVLPSSLLGPSDFAFHTIELGDGECLATIVFEIERQ